MSKIGKKPIDIPEGVEVQMMDNFLNFKGKEGILKLKLLPYINHEIKNGQIILKTEHKHKQAIANWGTIASLIKSSLIGVRDGFSKKLQLEGIGYKINMEGKDLILNIGLSHPIKFKSPADIKIAVEKNIITVSGPSKFLVGEVAARIRKIKKPDPYQGKGIRYQGEVVRRKAGKKAISAGSGVGA